MAALADILLAAFLREEQFYAQYSSVVDDTMFDSSPHKICINVYIDYINRYNNMPSEEEMYADLERYCRKYGMDASIQQQAIETLIRCYKLNYSIEYARDHFIQFATTNKLTAAVIDAAKTIKNKGEELSERDYEKIQEQIEGALAIKARDVEGVLFSEVADDPVKFIESNNRYDKSSVVRTGIPTFDNAHVAGGPLPGELYVISAPPGRGKSTLLVNIGANAIISGKDVMHIFVGDNTEADGVLRYCARLTGVTLSQIMLNSQQYIASWSHLKENFNLGNLIIGAYPIDGPYVSDIRSFITKNMVRKNIKPEVIIIDYIDNCRRNDNMNSYEALGQLYKQFKNICEELKVVGWTASQPKVSTWESEENAGLASLAESSMKQHIIDGMITLSKRSDTQYSMYVPKMRRGRSDFEVGLQINYERMLVKESMVTRAVPQSTGSTLVTPASTSTSNPVISKNPYADEEETESEY